MKTLVHIHPTERKPPCESAEATADEIARAAEQAAAEQAAAEQAAAQQAAAEQAAQSQSSGSGKGGGSGYQWTRKVTQKTVTVALTQQQFAKLKEAVANYRQLRKCLREMEQLSRKIIFLETPHPARRKRLSPKALGLN